MSDFDAFLTRAFAEAEEPADNGFSLKVANAVARREARARLLAAAQTVFLAVAALAVGYVVIGLAMAFGPDLLAATGIEATRALGAFDADAPSVVNQAETVGAGLLQSTGLGLTQLLLIAGALAGGAVAYRTVQD